MTKPVQALEKLVHLTPQTARVLRSGTEKIIPAEQVQVQDLLRVLPGETIPVDGVITNGQTSINQAVMTGESLPADKTVGDAVSSGTVNQFGAFEMRATKVGADSSIQRMIQLVQSADAGKAKIVGLADRCGTYMVTEWADYSSRYHLVDFVRVPWYWQPQPQLWQPSETQPNMVSWCERAMPWSGLQALRKSCLTRPEH